MIQENALLKQEAIRLNNAIEIERRSSGSRVEFERLSSILIQRDVEIRTLNERIYSLQNQANLANEWQNRLNDSQSIIAQLNSKINSQNQQHDSQMNQMNLRLGQYQAEVALLTSRITQLGHSSPTKSDPQVEILRSQISGLSSKVQQY